MPPKLKRVWVETDAGWELATVVFAKLEEVILELPGPHGGVIRFAMPIERFRQSPLEWA